MLDSLVGSLLKGKTEHKAPSGLGDLYFAKNNQKNSSTQLLQPLPNTVFSTTDLLFIEICLLSRTTRKPWPAPNQLPLIKLATSKHIIDVPSQLVAHEWEGIQVLSLLLAASSRKLVRNAIQHHRPPLQHQIHRRPPTRCLRTLRPVRSKPK